MSDDENITRLEPHRTFTNKDNRVSDWRCRHNALWIDEHRRLLECKACGQIIEAFDYIIKVANQEARIRQDTSRLIAERTAVAEELDDLKRQKRNLKAQVNRLQRKHQ